MYTCACAAGGGRPAASQPPLLGPNSARPWLVTSPPARRHLTAPPVFRPQFCPTRYMYQKLSTSTSKSPSCVQHCGYPVTSPPPARAHDDEDPPCHPHNCDVVQLALHICRWRRHHLGGDWRSSCTAEFEQEHDGYPRRCWRPHWSEHQQWHADNMAVRADI
jgi:hypothetical protein